MDVSKMIPFTLQEQVQYADAIDALKFFLATAPGSFDQGPWDVNDPQQCEERALNRFLLPSRDMISCVFWRGLYYISGSDIVKSLAFRFLAFGRPVTNLKKFEEGIFSDLRNLKAGVDATLEESKSDLLNLLYKYSIIRTQKKQKVFYWYSVPHDRLFLDALDRDLKREKLGQDMTSMSISEPALSFHYIASKSLFDQYCNPKTAPKIPADCTLAQRHLRKQTLPIAVDSRKRNRADLEDGASFALLEGSPNYKPKRAASQKNKRQKSNTSPEAELPKPPSQPQPRVEESVAARYSTPMSKSSSYEMPILDQAPTNPYDRAIPATVPATSYELPIPASAPASRTRFMPALPVVAGMLPMSAPMRLPSPPSPHIEPEPGDGYLCPLYSCGRYFARMDLLKDHIRRHPIDEPYACHRCSRRFARPDSLELHLDLHEKIDSGDPAEHPHIHELEMQIDCEEAEYASMRQHDMTEVVNGVEALAAVAVAETEMMNGGHRYTMTHPHPQTHQHHYLPPPSRHEGTVDYRSLPYTSHQSGYYAGPLPYSTSPPLRSGWGHVDTTLPPPPLLQLNAHVGPADHGCPRIGPLHPIKRPSLTIEVDHGRRHRSATPTLGPPKVEGYANPIYGMQRSVSLDGGPLDHASRHYSDSLSAGPALPSQTNSSHFDVRHRRSDGETSKHCNNSPTLSQSPYGGATELPLRNPGPPCAPPVHHTASMSL